MFLNRSSIHCSIRVFLDMVIWDICGDAMTSGGVVRNCLWDIHSKDIHVYVCTCTSVDDEK